MPDNPYAPPDSPAPDPAEPLQSVRGIYYAMLLAAFAGYCLAAERWVDAYSIRTLIAAGGVPALPILCFLAGSGSLMIGVGRHMYAPWLGKHAFLFSAAVLAVGIASVNDSGAFGGATRLLLGLGVALALLGAWVVHRSCAIIEEYLKREGELGED